MLYTQAAVEASNGVKQLRRLGWTDYIWATEAVSANEFREVAGEDGNGVIFSISSVVPETPDEAVREEEKEYLMAYMEEYGEMPQTETSYRAYDSANLIFEAWKNAEDLDDPESVSEAFFNINGYEGVQGTFDFTSRTGEGFSNSVLFIVHEGKNVLLERYAQEHDMTKPYGEG